MEGKWKFLRALFYASGSNMPKGIDKHSVPMIGIVVMPRQTFSVYKAHLPD